MTRIAVIGAGLSGLVAARSLQRDHDVTVFERSRGAGGCGGILSKSMARLGAKVKGIDVVEKNIAIASLNAAQRGFPIDYQLCTASELADSGTQFGVVLNMEVVEHLADVSVFMQNCARLVGDSGAMFVTTINRSQSTTCCSALARSAERRFEC